MPSWGCLQFAASIQPVEFSLACSFPLRQFFEPGKVLARIFDTTRRSIAHELEDEFHPFQGWIEAHQEERIEFRLECVRVDDLVIALPIIDLSLGERMDHHQVKRSLVVGWIPLPKLKTTVSKTVISDCGLEPLLGRQVGSAGRGHGALVPTTKES